MNEVTLNEPAVFMQLNETFPEFSGAYSKQSCVGLGIWRDNVLIGSWALWPRSQNIGTFVVCSASPRSWQADTLMQVQSVMFEPEYFGWRRLETVVRKRKGKNRVAGLCKAMGGKAEGLCRRGWDGEHDATLWSFMPEEIWPYRMRYGQSTGTT